MKIYVDELPKSCYECEFCGKLKPPAKRPEIECMHCNMMKRLNTVSDFCPLQSIADHDAELLQNAIVPKFKVGQTVYGIRFTLAYEDIVEFDIEEVVIGNDTIRYKGYYDESFAQRWLFATCEEAEQKLKEIKGEN